MVFLEPIAWICVSGSWGMPPNRYRLRPINREGDDELGTKDATFGVFTMADGTIWSMNICWALPQEWPGAVYGLEIGIVGTKG